VAELDAARLTCISHQAIGKYEKGTATPSSHVLIRLAKALGVRTEFLTFSRWRWRGFRKPSW